MKACVLHAVADLRCEEVPTPSPQPGQVLVKVAASGICGSDVQRVWQKGTYSFPTIPGHEFSGHVCALGEGADESLAGRRVTVFPLVPCMRCEACQVGEYASCTDYNYYGSRCDGGFAEYIAVNAWNLVPVPEGVSCEAAAMAEPAAVAIHTLRRASLEIGDAVAIFGAGPIGLMLAAWVQAAGGTPLLVDIDRQKIEFAEQMGFTSLYNGAGDEAVAAILEITGGRGADIAIEGTGVGKVLEQSFACTRSFGRVVGMGNPLGEVCLSQKAYWNLMRKQLCLYGTWNSSYASLYKSDWVLSLNAMAEGRLAVERFVTHRFSLEQGVKAMELVRDKNEFYNKVMFVTEEAPS